MGGDRALISVVDDDVSIRESLPPLLRSFGFDSIAFGSAEDLLKSAALDSIDCLLIDVTMPGTSGPELHRELARRGHKIPSLFITAIHDDNLRSQLVRQGAVDCLFKPFNDDRLEEAVLRALATA